MFRVLYRNPWHFPVLLPPSDRPATHGQQSLWSWGSPRREVHYHVCLPSRRGFSIAHLGNRGRMGPTWAAGPAYPSLIQDRRSTVAQIASALVLREAQGDAVGDPAGALPSTCLSHQPACRCLERTCLLPVGCPGSWPQTQPGKWVLPSRRASTESLPSRISQKSHLLI